MAHSGRGRFKLTQEQVDEIRTLRRQDPEKWTWGKLAIKYQVERSTVYRIFARIKRAERIDIHSPMNNVCLREDFTPKVEKKNRPLWMESE